MILDTPVRWDELAGLYANSIRLLADPAGAPSPQWPPLSTRRPVIVAVGPEGGFTPLEKTTADQNGWFAIRVSSSTLRIETAGLAACAALFNRAVDGNE